MPLSERDLQAMKTAASAVRAYHRRVEGLGKVAAPVGYGVQGFARAAAQAAQAHRRQIGQAAAGLAKAAEGQRTGWQRAVQGVAQAAQAHRRQIALAALQIGRLGLGRAIHHLEGATPSAAWARTWLLRLDARLDRLEARVRAYLPDGYDFRLALIAGATASSVVERVQDLEPLKRVIRPLAASITRHAPPRPAAEGCVNEHAVNLAA